MVFARIVALVMLTSQPVLSADWDFGTTTPEEVAEVLRECLVKKDAGRHWSECVGLYSKPCEYVRTDFYRCFETEGAAWMVVLAEEFAMTLAESAKGDQVDAGTPFESRAKFLCAGQSAWLDFSTNECNFRCAIPGRGSIRKVYGTLCQQRLAADRAISLRDARTKPADETYYETYRALVGLSEADFRSEVGVWCDAEIGELQ